MQVRQRLARGTSSSSTYTNTSSFHSGDSTPVPSPEKKPRSPSAPNHISPTVATTVASASNTTTSGPPGVPPTSPRSLLFTFPESPARQHRVTNTLLLHSHHSPRLQTTHHSMMNISQHQHPQQQQQLKRQSTASWYVWMLRMVSRASVRSVVVVVGLYLLAMILAILSFVYTPMDNYYSGTSNGSIYTMIHQDASNGVLLNATLRDGGNSGSSSSSSGGTRGGRGVGLVAPLMVTKVPGTRKDNEEVNRRVSTVNIGGKEEHPTDKLQIVGERISLGQRTNETDNADVVVETSSSKGLLKDDSSASTVSLHEVIQEKVNDTQEFKSNVSITETFEVDSNNSLTNPQAIPPSLSIDSDLSVNHVNLTTNVLGSEQNQTNVQRQYNVTNIQVDKNQTSFKRDYNLTILRTEKNQTSLPVEINGTDVPGDEQQIPRYPRVVYWFPEDEAAGVPMLDAPAVNVTRSNTSPSVTIFELPVNASLSSNDLRHWEAPDDGCLPLADWQTKSFPTCNSVHELDLHTPYLPQTKSSEYDLDPLGEGWFRSAYKVHYKWPRDDADDADEIEDDDPHHVHHHHHHKDSKRQRDRKDKNKDTIIVLKMLRFARDYLPEYYELHRRDAVAMERLTQSEFVLDVYGYCGQSALNEIASFEFSSINSLEGFNKKMRGHENSIARRIKLRMAASIALGVADIHAAGLADDNDKDKKNKVASMVHYDLNPRNVALTKGGKPKINDFNIVEFLRYRTVPGSSADSNKKKKTMARNETCGFEARLHEPWWRAPEEMAKHYVVKSNGSAVDFPTVKVDEKVDVYALGNLIQNIMTTHSPRGKLKEHRMDEVREIVAKGVRPILPEPYASDQDPVYVAFRKALDICFVADPKKRGSAAEAAQILIEAMSDDA